MYNYWQDFIYGHRKIILLNMCEHEQFESIIPNYVSMQILFIMILFQLHEKRRVMKVDKELATNRLLQIIVAG